MSIDANYYTILDNVVHSNWPGSAIRWTAGVPSITFPGDLEEEPSDSDVEDACVAFLVAGSSSSIQTMSDRFGALDVMNEGGAAGHLARAIVLFAGGRTNAAITAINAIVDAGFGHADP